MVITWKNDNKMLSAVFFSLYVGLCLNFIAPISVVTFFIAVAFYGFVATMLIQPLFHLLYGMSAYKDVIVKKPWGDLKLQLEQLKKEIPQLKIPSMSYKLDHSPNAFAISGLLSNGLICVHSGLLDKIDTFKTFPQELKDEVRRKLSIKEEPSEEQIKAHLLRAILAHEVGHLHFNHGLKKTFLGAFVKMFLRPFPLLTLVSHKVTDFFMRNIFMHLPLSYYSRGCETQADNFATIHGYAQGLKFSLKEIFSQNKEILDFHSQDFAEPIMKTYRQLTATHPCQEQRLHDIDQANKKLETKFKFKK